MLTGFILRVDEEVLLEDSNIESLPEASNARVYLN